MFGYRNRAGIEKLAARSAGRLRVVDGRSAYLPIGKEVVDPDAVYAVVKSVLQPA
ncbi:MAG TPA: hypothetical protein VFW87_05390 [Pirellulales bacterium]|nr:hypothetical protein [Pirellulales bacterium]